MRRISPLKAAISVGSVVGLWHLLWASVVALGWGKPILDFILRLHFIDLNYALAPFNLTTAAALVILTFAIGCCFGFFFAIFWNWLSFETAPTWARDTKHPTPAE